LVKKAYYDGQYSYGLILMDCSMPIMDGYTATESIRAYARKKSLLQPRVVACTGHVEEEYVQKAFRYEMDEVVAKPANIDVIMEILKESLEVVAKK